MDQHTTHFREDLILKLANELTFLAFFATNILCLASGVYGHGHVVFIEPTSRTSAVIWMTTQILFIGALAYQWTDKGKTLVIDALHWRLSAMFVLAAAHLHIWYHRHWLPAFFFALFFAAAVAHSYYLIKKWYPARNVYDEVFIHAPISILQGWVSFLVFEMAFEAFGEEKGFGPKPWTIAYFAISVVIMVILAFGYAFATPEGDFAATIVIPWCLYGVLWRTSEGGALWYIGWSGFWISSALTVKAAYGFYKYRFATLKDSFVHGHDVEHAPLLGTEEDH